MNSGIFLPPNRISTAIMIKIHSEHPGMANKNVLFVNIILIFDRQQIYSFFYGNGSAMAKKNPA
jgi:hypothetical protein